jgi:hypothetical protein
MVSNPKMGKMNIALKRKCVLAKKLLRYITKSVAAAQL